MVVVVATQAVPCHSLAGPLTSSAWVVAGLPDRALAGTVAVALGALVTVAVVAVSLACSLGPFLREMRLSLPLAGAGARTTQPLLGVPVVVLAASTGEIILGTAERNLRVVLLGAPLYKVVVVLVIPMAGAVVAVVTTVAAVAVAGH